MFAVDQRVVERVSLFSELAKEDLAVLATRLRQRRYPKGQVIFAQGDPGNALYILESGRVKIVLNSAEGRDLVVSVLGPGDFFGELALLDGEPRSADAVAMEPCQLWLLAREEFLPFIEERPRVAVRLLAVLSQRLRRTNERAQDVAFLDVPARLARSLLELAPTGDATKADFAPSSFKVTQTELAGLTGTTRETVNKWLAYYENKGMIHCQRGQVTILRPELLRKRIY